MLSELEKGLGYVFRDKALLTNALTHSSYANENRDRGIHDNERLEFLGDSILGFVVADYLYRNFPGKPEGEYHPAGRISPARPWRGKRRRQKARQHRFRRDGVRHCRLVYGRRL